MGGSPRNTEQPFTGRANILDIPILCSVTLKHLVTGLSIEHLKFILNVKRIPYDTRTGIEGVNLSQTRLYKQRLVEPLIQYYKNKNKLD